MFSVFSFFFFGFLWTKGECGEGELCLLSCFLKTNSNQQYQESWSCNCTISISQVFSGASYGVSSRALNLGTLSLKKSTHTSDTFLASGFWRLGLEVVLQLPASDCFREKLFHILSQNTVQNIILLLDFALIFFVLVLKA